MVRGACRVLVVSGTYPPDIGGSEISLHTGLVELRRRGFEVVVVADDRHAPDSVVDGVRVLGTSSNCLIERLDELHREYGFDIVMTQLIFGPRAISWARGLGLPSIYFVRNTGIRLDLSTGGACFPDYIVANSKFTASAVAERFGRTAEVIYPFIRKEDFVPETRTPSYITMVNPLKLKGGEVLRYLAKRHSDREFLAVRGVDGVKERVHGLGPQDLGPAEGSPW